MSDVEVSLAEVSGQIERVETMLKMSLAEQRKTNDAIWQRHDEEVERREKGDEALGARVLGVEKSQAKWFGGAVAVSTVLAAALKLFF